MQSNVVNLNRKKQEKQVSTRNELNAMLSSVVEVKKRIAHVEMVLKASKRQKGITESKFNGECKEAWNNAICFIMNEMDIKETIKGLGRNLKKAVDEVVDEVKELKEEVVFNSKENKTSINQEVSKMFKLISGSYNDYIQVMNDETIHDFEGLIDKKIENTWPKKAK